MLLLGKFYSLKADISRILKNSDKETLSKDLESVVFKLSAVENKVNFQSKGKNTKDSSSVELVKASEHNVSVII